MGATLDDKIILPSQYKQTWVNNCGFEPVFDEDFHQVFEPASRRLSNAVKCSLKFQCLTTATELLVVVVSLGDRDVNNTKNNNLARPGMTALLQRKQDWFWEILRLERHYRDAT